MDTPSKLIPPDKRGLALLHDPLLNKGTAFTEQERRDFGLMGLLPPRISTLAEQVERIYDNFRSKATPLEQYIYLIGLQDRNETLFYRLVMDHIEEVLPVIYTPTVGQACQLYGQIFRRSRGIFITRRHRGQMHRVLRNWPHRDVRVIVVTDGERILGLGDLGANGMGIPVGKLSLYTACAGVQPVHTLPVTLDVGTNNATMRQDPYYLGTADARLSGQEYDDFVEEFITAVQEVFPGALVQFEDFGNQNAFRLLERYRGRIPTFNDDIQGTAAVTLAGLYSALRLLGGRLEEQRFLFHGAGEAALGIGELIVMALQRGGMSRDEAKQRCWFMDSRGLVIKARNDLQEHKLAFAHTHAPLTDLLQAVETLRPTTLIGVSGQANQFTQSVIAEMSRLNPRPIIFALSNPTANAECTAEQAYAWSNGQAIFASGSPFAPVSLHGRTLVPSQANNAYIFPGVGLGTMLSGSRAVADEMFFAAARTLSDLVSDAELQSGALFPPFTRIREVSAHIAAAVAQLAFDQRLTSAPRPEDLLTWVQTQQYEPLYLRYVC